MVTDQEVKDAIRRDQQVSILKQIHAAYSKSLKNLPRRKMRPSERAMTAASLKQRLGVIEQIITIVCKHHDKLQ